MLALAVAITLGATLYAVALAPRLPDLIPTHWGVNGEVDGWAPKPQAIYMMPAMMAGLLLLMSLLPSVSPRKYRVEGFRQVWNVVVLLVLAMLGFIHVMMLQTALHPGVTMDRAVIAGLCLFLAVVGLYLPQVKRNFWMGVRTPWTLASEAVWTATHRLAAWTMGLGGLLGALLVLVGVPPMLAFGLIMVGALYPVFYSLWLYKKLEREGKAGE